MTRCLLAGGKRRLWLCCWAAARAFRVAAAPAPTTRRCWTSIGGFRAPQIRPASATPGAPPRNLSRPKRWRSGTTSSRRPRTVSRAGAASRRVSPAGGDPGALAHPGPCRRPPSPPIQTPRTSSSDGPAREAANSREPCATGFRARCSPRGHGCPTWISWLPSRVPSNRRRMSSMKAFARFTWFS